MIDSTILNKHYRDYILCFSNDCPLREHCLRWQVAQCPVSDVRIVTCVNLAAPTVRTSDCTFYRKAEAFRIARGMVNFYHEMPHYMEIAIKKDLIKQFRRTHYYDMRRGVVPISPADQQTIAAICQKHGWKEPPVFDRYELDYLWD